MNQIVAIQPERLHQPAPYRFTAADLRAMSEAGVFAKRRVELVDGELFEMPDEGALHQGLRERIQNHLFAWCYEQARGFWIIGSNGPIRLGERDEPEPDIYVRPASLSLLTFKVRDCPLLIEIASTSHAHDFGRKSPRYARFGAPELWIIDAVKKVVVVHRGPAPDGTWDAVLRMSADEIVSPLAFPDLGFRLADHLSAEDEED